MKHDNNEKPEKKEVSTPDKKTKWVDKAEAFMDEAAEKIHQSEVYIKAGKSVESATKKIFREAGKWWGKSEQFFKKS
jgi:hypothetical protein